MGCNGRNFECMTCEGDDLECPGHFGHIQLSQPIFHPGFIKTIFNILKCVCYYCGQLLIEKSSLRYQQIRDIKDHQKRLSELSKYSSCIRTCDHLTRESGKEENEVKEVNIGCGQRQPQFTQIQENIFIQVFGIDNSQRQKKKHQIRQKETLHVLNLIQVEDYEILGFNSQYTRPPNMIFEVLPILPIPSRPSV